MPAAKKNASQQNRAAKNDSPAANDRTNDGRVLASVIVHSASGKSAIKDPVGNGSYTLHVIATDLGGKTLDLGTVAISVNNTTSLLPFGTIDTPAQGATISGTTSYNFGWALTPEPNIIPTDGSTITVFIDTPCISSVVPVCNPMAVPPTAYNLARCDVDQLFPSYANSGSTQCSLNGTTPGPVGYWVFDTTKLANGLHSLGWLVIDSAGHAQGIGSRY